MTQFFDFLKQYPVWRENSKWPPYKLTISGFSSYLENYMRYLKKLNGICSGFVFARKHNSLIFKKNYPVWRENPKLPPYRVTISDFSSYLEILMRYLKNINGISLGVFALGDTFLWFWKTYPVLRKKLDVRTYRLPISDFSHNSRNRWDIISI